jgi:hypothetical protein
MKACSWDYLDVVFLDPAVLGSALGDTCHLEKLRNFSSILQSSDFVSSISKVRVLFELTS